MRVFFRSLALLLGIFSDQMEAYEKEVNAAGWGTASQSSVEYYQYPQNALDGNPSTFTHTQTESNPWWRLELLNVYSVNRVVITNRRDCCSEWINGAEIRVGSVSSDAFSNPICAVISSLPSGASYSYSCNRMAGQYVFVVIPGNNKILNLAEVEVYVVYPGNLAAGRNVTQSSTYYSWIAAKAIDFNLGFHIQPWLACSSTSYQTNPWWRLDLGQIYRVSKVVITNRQDCCPEQINGAEIRIGNSLDNNGNNNPVCAVISSIPAGVSSTYTCNNMEGRYVNLIIPGDSRFLSLCEVEVYEEGIFTEQMEAYEKEVNAGRWGTASQSSAEYYQYAQNALDGNLFICSSTLTENNPWWRLDLLKVYRVNRVVITNRLDSYSERINGAEIRVGNVSSDAFSNPICAVISSLPSGASYSYSCNRMEGQYVFVVIPGNNKMLTIAEVEVYVVYPGNLAAGGNVTQSSTYYSWIAAKAIDFNPGFTQPSLACSSTNNQPYPWWRLDLGHIYRVSKVVVTNRRDYMPEQINGAEIRIGNSLDNNGNNNPVCAVISSIPAGVSATYTCNDMEGRYVNLIIPGNSRTLTLCEVEVYGEGNLAIGRSVTQSSTHESWIAEQAIDLNPGLTQPSLACSSTNTQRNPWWRLDLRNIYRVSKVVITNRRDCCPERINGAEIRIGNSLKNNDNNNPVCAVISSIPAGVSATYTCNNMEGRYVNLIIPEDSRILTLCEVEVYAEDLIQLC